MLREMIQQIILIVLVGTLIDMLLPTGRLQPLVRLVAGIFIMVAVLTPIMSWLSQPNWAETLSMRSNAVADGGYQAVREQGEAMRQEAGAQAAVEAQGRLARQIEAVAMMKSGVQEARADVQMETEGNRSGEIREIRVTLRRGVAEAVEPVMVPDMGGASVETGGAVATAGGAPSPAGGRADAGAPAGKGDEGLVRALSGLYGVPAERVYVVWE
ncbi:stage III sporulation protein AF [Heliophilum fasciatum]|uniref:stage III sporulation protein AF n=1 Tax=Heliophilum fasciatum TaxID=35700 RepID=UPI001FAA3EA7|nr:stage III sporulation protein AF [Heliophilum fasciatum]